MCVCVFVVTCMFIYKKIWFGFRMDLISFCFCSADTHEFVSIDENEREKRKKEKNTGTVKRHAWLVFASCLFTMCMCACVR